MAHLHGIEITNFRIFNDPTKFELKPITILTGPNSSGKSSFNKLLLLLHENFSRKLIFEELDFNSNLHHLKSFDSVLSNPRNNKLSLKFPIKILFYVEGKTDSISENFTLEINFIGRENKSENAFIDEIKIFHSDSKEILIALKFTGRLIYYPELIYEKSKSFEIIPTINLNYIFKKIKNIFENGKVEYIFYDLVPHRPGDTNGPRGINTLLLNFDQREISLRLGKAEQVIEVKLPYIENILDLLDIEFLDNYNNKEIINKLKLNAINALSKGICSFKDDIDFIKFWSKIDCFWIFRSNNYKIVNVFGKIDEETFNPVVTQSIIPAYNLEVLFQYIPIFESLFYEVVYGIINENIGDEIFPDPKYIMKYPDIVEEKRNELVKEPLKSIEKVFGLILHESFKYLHACFDDLHFYFLPSIRSYPARIYFKDDISFVFNNILKEYYEIQHRLNRIEKSFLNYWLKKFIGGEELIIERPENTVSIAYVKIKNKKINIADLGFGYTQWLPILMQILIIARKNIIDDEFIESIEYRKSILIIEEPESNLHPNFESLLADMIIDSADRFYIQFIIETHSEYLIRKLQYLVAKRKIKSDSIVIYYFNRKNIKNKIKEINISDNGKLSSEFGTGFYDESSKLMMMLFTDQIDN